MTMPKLFFLGLAMLVVGSDVRPADLSSTARTDTLIWQYRVSHSSFRVLCHRRTTILSAAGRDFGTVAVEESKFGEINSVEVQVIDASGRAIARIRKKDMSKFCGYGASYDLYSDNCTYAYTPQVSTYPYTVVVDYEKEFSSLFFLNGVWFNRKIPISFAQVQLDYDSAQPVRYKAYQLDVAPVETREQDRGIVTWTIQDLPAARELTMLPPEWVDGSSIRFAPAEFELDDYVCRPLTWKNLGLFYRDLSEGRYLPPSAAVNSLSHDATVALCGLIYDSVAHGTRYVSVSIGLSGWRPQAANVTQSVGYGDCKAVSALLVSRLRQAGITSYPCLVLTKDEGAIDTLFPASDFNHVIAMAIVDRDTLWFDGTSQTCPAGELPDDDEGNIVLAVTDTGGVLVRTPISPADQNSVVRSADILIDSAGQASIHVTAHLRGHLARSARDYLRGEKQEDKDRYVEQYFGRGNTQVRIDSAHIEDLDSPALPLKLGARLSATRAVEQIKLVRYLFPFNFATRAPYEGLDLQTRTIPVNLYYPYSVVDSTAVRSPWTGIADSVRLPQSDSASYPGGSVTVSYRADSSAITCVLKQRFDLPLLKVEDFPRFEAFLAARKKMLDRPIKWYLKTN